MNSKHRLLSFNVVVLAGMIASAARADVLYVSTELRDVDKITSAAAVSVFASEPPFPAGAYPDGLAFDSLGNLYATDPNKRLINMITPSGTVSLFKTLATSSFPAGLAIDGSDNLYVQTPNSDISKITPAGTLSHYATLPTGTDPAGLAFDSSGNLYVADGNNNRIHKITPSGTVSLFASLPAGTLPEGLAFDGIGNLYEAGLDNLVHKITAGGAVSLFATLPNSPASEAVGLAFDSSGNLYAAGLSGEISKIASDGTVSHFATATTSALYIAVTDDAGHPLAVPPATLLGDYNRNGVVDAADYTVWRDGLGSVYNQADYAIWINNFGAHTDSGSGATAAVPEPSTGTLLLVAAALFAWRGLDRPRSRIARGLRSSAGVFRSSAL
jgi:streptogramin lyase